MPDVSIVIPVYRDGTALARLLASLDTDPGVAEVLVACVAEERDDIRVVCGARPDVRLVEAPRGRARQMNAAASVASGEWLLFLHADTRLPAGWDAAIQDAGSDPRVAIGCFRFALDDDSRAARTIEAGVRLRVACFQLPYGDQALFLRRAFFARLGGYSDMPIMEDVDLVRRARRHGRLFVSPLAATTSARRWRQQGWAGRTALHLGLIALYAAGVSPETLARIDRARRL